jgi:hypothetical protein
MFKSTLSSEEIVLLFVTFDPSTNNETQAISVLAPTHLLYNLTELTEISSEPVVKSKEPTFTPAATGRVVQAGS